MLKEKVIVMPSGENAVPGVQGFQETRKGVVAPKPAPTKRAPVPVVASEIPASTVSGVYEQYLNKLETPTDNLEDTGAHDGYDDFSGDVDFVWPPTDEDLMTPEDKAGVVAIREAEDEVEAALVDARAHGINERNLEQFRRADRLIAENLAYVTIPAQAMMWDYWMAAQSDKNLVRVPEDVMKWGCDCGFAHYQFEDCGPQDDPEWDPDNDPYPW